MLAITPQTKLCYSKTVAWLKRFWIPLVVCIGFGLCGLLVATVNPYHLLANFYNQPSLPSRPFNAADWPRNPYTEKQLPIRQAMTDSILKKFRPGMTRRDVEANLGTPDRFETEQQLMTRNELGLGFTKGDIAISYVVLQDFASGQFSICFLFDQKDHLKRLFYRWG
jgi:hypothetical protein